MLFQSTLLPFCAIASLVAAAPIPLMRREVPQEHSHEAVLTSVRASLNKNNPQGIVDVVFGLLGNAAAAGGLGKTTDPDCLQQATADQAFTNAKAANDIPGMTNALIFRALERNTGKVGQASAACTSVKAVNPQIAAVSQHQDPASAGAAAINKAIVLSLAKQIASIGGNPQDALKSGTFKAGLVTDTTGKGNTCDVQNDAAGCIFSQNLIVNDATAAEITAAAGGAAAPAAAAPAKAAPAPAAPAKAAPAAPVACAAAPAAAAPAPAKAAPAAPAPAASGANLQTFTGNLGGSLAIPVVAGGRGFLVDNTSDVGLGAALQRSCSVQNNACSNAANSSGNKGALTVSACGAQNNACNAAIAGIVAAHGARA